MNIEEVLNRYFEGETSVAEERELRRFFCRGGCSGSSVRLPSAVRIL